MSKFNFQYFMDHEDGKIARVETTGYLQIPLNIFIDNAEDFSDAAEGPCSIDVCGVGRDVEVFASEEAYRGSGRKTDVISLIPSGTFPLDPNDADFQQDAWIVFSGRALDVEFDPEAGSDDPNYLVHVETLEMTLRLFLRSETPIEKGNVLHGGAWLYGDLEM